MLAPNPNTYFYRCGVATIAKGYTDVTFIIGGTNSSSVIASDVTESTLSNAIYICYSPENTNTIKIIKLSQTLDKPCCNPAVTTVYDRYFN